MNKPLIVITGASSGIGAAMAQVFSNAGHPVGLIARNLDAMKKLNLKNSLCQSVDVTDYNALTKAINTLQNEFGPIDCLVNNAGFSKGGDFTEIEHHDHETTVQVNLLGEKNRNYH
jgi:NADP-dependent 3-hydroxy acid dehydrogenase YdfG